jgi:RNA polymerase sigma-70 factor (ECF subfamily)
MDTELVEKIKSGDQRAFEQLVTQYEKTVYSISLRILGNNDTALDASQDVFLKIYRSINTFRAESRLSTWIYRITVNMCMDYIRKNERHKALSLNQGEDGEPGLEFNIADTNPTPDQHLDICETKEMMRQAIEKLSKDHKAVIVLRDIQGYSYSEIADILSCSEGTVKSRINRARERLRTILVHDWNFKSEHSSYLNRKGEEICAIVKKSENI